MDDSTTTQLTEDEQIELARQIQANKDFPKDVERLYATINASIKSQRDDSTPPAFHYIVMNVNFTWDVVRVMNELVKLETAKHAKRMKSVEYLSKNNKPIPPVEPSLSDCELVLYSDDKDAVYCVCSEWFQPIFNRTPHIRSQLAYDSPMTKTYNSVLINADDLPTKNPMQDKDIVVHKASFSRLLSENVISKSDGDDDELVFGDDMLGML
jgi:hypothetical protein